MSRPLSNEQILEQFKKATAVMEVRNENRFRIRAYQTAMETIDNLNEELHTILQRRALNTVPGIGPELRGKITDLLTTGKTREWEDMFSSVPQGMFSLLNVPGIGPKRAYQIAEAFHLTDPETAIDQVKIAADEGKLSELERFGKKLEQQIRENLNRPKAKITRMRIDVAEAIAGKVVALLKKIPEVLTVSVLGSLRRREETIGDVDIAVATSDPEKVVENIRLNAEDLLDVVAEGNNIIRLVFIGNRQADIKFQTPRKFGATLQHFTGSKYHNIALREFALQQEKSLSEHGIKYRGRLKTFADEESFYKDLGLVYIPPELRQNTGEIEAALTGTLPELVELKDIKGEFHTHTDFNWRSSHDYGDSIDSLLTTAAVLHYEWIALGDHNPSQKSYTPAEMAIVVKERDAYIDAAYRRWQQNHDERIRILKTLEVDILPDGSLPLPDEAFDLLDFIIVSVHSQLNLGNSEQTKRLLKALSHPKVKILGHPTGRLLTNRTGIEADWIKIFNECYVRNIAIEVNGQPSRLDAPDTLAFQAVKRGVKLALATDAHLHDDLMYMRYAVDVARRAWAAKSDIINTYTYQDALSWIKK